MSSSPSPSAGSASGDVANPSTAPVLHLDTPSPVDLATLASIERRVLWLAVRMVDFANRERPSTDDLKVGGHQASSASMVSLMTALWVADLDGRDRVSVKPHAAPCLHALEYLLGRLDRSYLPRLRDFGGLQSYPSRTKDPFPVDYSTGSVGLGSAAPLFGALADRYVESRFGTSTGGRFISLIGDAELDEGNVWEAINEPLTRELGNVVWLIDLNRQSLDRVVPGIRAAELEAQFAAAGWNVIELKAGSRLRRAFDEDGGEFLRRRIDEMENEQYEALFGAADDDIASALLDGLSEPERGCLARLLAVHSTDLGSLIHDLGGHDLGDILGALRQARASSRPTVVFAYTIKGYGLELAALPHNHSALLTAAQIDGFRSECGLTLETEWDSFDDDTPEGVALRRARERLERPVSLRSVEIDVPPVVSGKHPERTSTQATLGRLLLDVSRVDRVADRLVTVSPDVSSSTNLGGFINKVGVWGHADSTEPSSQKGSALRWKVAKSGQHVEVGIAEMNLALLLGQLGLTWDFQGQPLLPIGTLYDPFVMRALEGIVYSVYCGARFVLCGTPSGISLSREGGAHQSFNTPGIGIETPGLTYFEPCFALEFEWLLLDALAQLHAPNGQSGYFRLSTKTIDQTPFVGLVEARGADATRADVIRGGVRLRGADPDAEDRVVIATCGALAPEALAAADVLASDEGVEATVLLLSSPDRIYHDWRYSCLSVMNGASAHTTAHIDSLIERSERGLPVVTVIDGASHALAWVGSALGSTSVPLGVDAFGQTGSQAELYAAHRVDRESIVLGCLIALEAEEERA